MFFAIVQPKSKLVSEDTIFRLGRRLFRTLKMPRAERPRTTLEYIHMLESYGAIQTSYTVH